jgi:RNAse (barnase) inhibitor barstar
VPTFEIDGSAVRGIPSLYDELNRVFMADADWRMGQSLDALNDILYGIDGAIVVWRDHDQSRAALGRKATAEYYREKLRHPETFNEALFREKLDDLEAGAGPTYFDIVLEVFADHPEIDLRLP